jgi:hypothetical protein
MNHATNAIEIEDIEARVAPLAVRFVAESAAKGDEEPPVALRPERFVATGARSQGLAFRDRSAILTPNTHQEGTPCVIILWRTFRTAWP